MNNRHSSRFYWNNDRRNHCRSAGVAWQSQANLSGLVVWIPCDRYHYYYISGMVFGESPTSLSSSCLNFPGRVRAELDSPTQTIWLLVWSGVSHPSLRIATNYLTPHWNCMHSGTVQTGLATTSFAAAVIIAFLVSPVSQYKVRLNISWPFNRTQLCENFDLVDTERS